jgi:hypothetical protein
MSAASLLSHQSSGSALSHRSSGSVLSSECNRALLSQGRSDRQVPAGAVGAVVLATLLAAAAHRARR